MTELTIEALFDLHRTAADAYLRAYTYPWEALDGIADFVRAYGRTLSDGAQRDAYRTPEENGIPEVWIARSARIAPNATIIGPCVIGPETEVRPGAFIRGSVLIGTGCVIGNSCELKNAILFDRVQVPHFNYVGDSILGYRAHLGAGAVTSNVKSDKSDVTVRVPEGRIATGRRKFGAAVGDLCEVGCNSVLCPGTVLGRECTVYPLSRVRGYVPEGCIFKETERIVKKVR